MKTKFAHGKKVFHFTINNILKFLSENLDFLLIGKILGDKALGFYSTAFNMLNYLLVTPRMTFNKVLFSTYSKMKDDLSELRNAFLKSGKYICMLFIPIFAGFGAISEVLIVFLLNSVFY